MQRPVFYAIAIIISGYLPIFTLQRVEGRLFKPMAWTVGFALLGAMIFSMTIAPVLVSFLFKKETPEWHNPAVVWLTKKYRKGLTWCIHHRGAMVGIATLTLCAIVYLAASGVIGSEFLPHLDEGAIWVRGTLAPSTGPTEGIRIANQARVVLASFPEVTIATSQVGRPDDGTDFTGFFNTEYCVNLKPKGEVAAGLPPAQGEAGRCHEPGAPEDTRRGLELLPAHRGQHGRGGQRGQGTARDEDLR